VDEFVIAGHGLAEVPLHVRVVRWLDRYMDPLLVFLALATVPLLVAETANPGSGDRRVILVTNWAIYAAFAINFLLRLAVAKDRRAVLRELRWDAVIVIGQPILAFAEVGTAGLGTALVRLAAVLFRTISRGGVVKRTWRKVVDQPLKLLVGGVPLLLLLFAAIVYKAERSYGAGGSVHTIGEALWWSAATMATVGYGDISPRSPWGRIAAVMAMVAGIGAFSILTAKMAELLLASRDGSSRTHVDATDHTLLLGHSPKLHTILRQLIQANASRPSADVVVLSRHPRGEVERQIYAHVPEIRTSTTTVTCRTGSPSDVVDLGRTWPNLARAIIVLEDSATSTVTALMALLNGPQPPRPDAPIIAEVPSPGIARAVREAFGERVLVVEPQSLIARITAQSSRQPGLGIAYEDLLDFEGSEFYEVPIMPEAIGLAFGELLNAFPTCCPVGVVDGGGSLVLVPPMHRKVAHTDTLILLAEDESAVVFDGPSSVEASAPNDAEHSAAHSPERVVVVGWNEVGNRLLEEMDRALPLGSSVMVVVDRDTCKGPEGLTLQATLSIRSVASEEYPTVLTEGIGNGCDHVIILSERNLSADESDARSLLATLQARHALDSLPTGELGRSLVTQLLDEANVSLARQTSAGEFIVSERLTSLLMTQLAETPDLQRVFDQLLDPEGPELNALPIEWYTSAGVPVSFASLVESARLRGEIAVGLRLARYATQSERSFGVVMNPPKSIQTSFDPQDRLIVLTRRGEAAPEAER
jgi:voltage-gated potassium channel Kch